MDRAKLEFQNLCYSVITRAGGMRRQHKTHHVLRSISGTFEPGDCVALMGCSGAGKSTLMNIVSRRILGHTGSVLLNGKPVDSTTMASRACLIHQEDCFFGFLTVEEHLKSQAQLRVPLPEYQRSDRVDQVVIEFGLDKIKQSRIGDLEQGAQRGISGGEKKRLAVATDLLTNPSVVFADEPTSGLDSCKAEALIRTLRALADNGHTVVATIHQPSSQVFALFNKVMLLWEGRLLYLGPRLGVLPYFLRLGCPCPPYTNPADFIIELVSVSYENLHSKTETLHDWSVAWSKYGGAFIREWDQELHGRLLLSIGPGNAEDGGVVGNGWCGGGNRNQHYSTPAVSTTGQQRNQIIFSTPASKITGKPLQSSWWNTFTAVFFRAVRVTSRNPSVVRARLFQAIVTGMLGGMVFFRLEDHSWYSRSGAVFFMMINQAFMATFTALMAFVAEKKVVLRETQGGLYGLGTYFLSKILSDFLFQFHLPVLYTAVCWFLIGLNDTPSRFLIAAGINWLINLACSSIGYIIGSVASSSGVAVALGPIVVLPCLLVSGFVVQKEALPDFWLWLYYLSPFVYANSALMRTVFLDVEFAFRYEDLGIEPSLDFAFRSNGNEVLRGFGLSTKPDRWIVDIAGLAAWAIGGRIVAGIIFVLMNRQSSGAVVRTAK